MIIGVGKTTSQQQQSIDTGEALFHYLWKNERLASHSPRI